MRKIAWTTTYTEAGGKVFQTGAVSNRKRELVHINVIQKPLLLKWVLHAGSQDVRRDCLT